MRLGYNVIWAYFVFSYFLQVIPFYYYYESSTIFHRGKLNIISWLYIIIFAGLSFFVARKRKIGFPQLEKLFAWLFKTFWLSPRNLWLLLFLVFSALFFMNNAGNYRYDQVSMSGQNSAIIYITILLKYLFYGDLFYHIIRGITVCNTISIPYKWIILLAHLLSATGITSMLFILVFLFIFTFPKIAYTLFTITPSKAFTLKRILKFVLIGILFIRLIFFAFSYGESIKKGVAVNEGFNIIFERADWFVQRFSTTIYGHTYLLEEYNDFDYAEAWFIPIDNFLYRIQVLSSIDLGFSKPIMPTINNLNSIVLNKFTDIGDDVGASPGILPGFLYLVPAPIAVICAALLLGYLGRLMNFVKANFLLGSIILLIILPFTKSFVTILTVFNPQFLFFIMFIGSCVLVKNEVKILNR